MRIEDCQLIELPKIVDERGNLSFIEGKQHIPFDIKRVFYIYDVPTASSRGAHAHKELHQFIICLSGGLDVSLDDGKTKKNIRLNRPWQGLHIPPMIWASEGNFDPNSLYLVLASLPYDENDYYRSYDEFLRAVSP